MKNTFGNSIILTLFGESHGDYVGAVLDGLAPGIKIDRDYIDKKLALRRPRGKISTARVEADEYIIASGEYHGYTTGTPLTVLIPNTNKKSGDYAKMEKIPRPSHADYTAEIKYHGFEDPRGGGHFSGRITAALVFAGALLSSALEEKGIYIGTHISSLGKVCDRGFSDYEADIKTLGERYFPTLSDEASEKMLALASECASEGDSIGGVLETAIIGLPAGVGEPWFDTLEGMLAHAVFSVPAIKGVEFGLGFGYNGARGSKVNDAFAVKEGKIVTLSNNNGGINGGISNGMPIIFRSAVKPTPSIFKEQKSVNLSDMTDTVLKIEGRHDPAIIHRARVVVDSVAAFVLADLLSARYGTDFLSTEVKKG